MRSFALSVSVPPALLVRQRGAWLHLKQHQQPSTSTTPEAGAAANGAAAASGAAAAGGGGATDGGSTDFPLIEFNSVVDVKDPLRWLLSPRLAALLSRAPQAGGAPGGADEGSDVRYDPSSVPKPNPDPDPDPNPNPNPDPNPNPNPEPSPNPNPKP